MGRVSYSRDGGIDDKERDKETNEISELPSGHHDGSKHAGF